MDDAVVQLDQATWQHVQRGIRLLDREAQKELNKAVRSSAREVAQTAKRNASWSSRIPSSIGVSVTTRRVAVKARKAKAPHARSLEGKPGQGTFRHPVFGNRDVWVAQSTRPFLRPAADYHRDEFLYDTARAIDAAAVGLGWR